MEKEFLGGGFIFGIPKDYRVFPKKARGKGAVVDISPDGDFTIYWGFKKKRLKPGEYLFEIVLKEAKKRGLYPRGLKYS
jgi:hypothetical protein